MSVFQGVVDVVRRAQRDIFVRQGIPAEGLMGPGWPGAMVDQATASRISYVHTAWSLLADAAGLLPVDVVAKVDEKTRTTVDAPDWLMQPDPSDPSITTEEHFSQAVVSLASDGNLFTLALPEVRDAAQVTVLDPQRVFVKKVRGEPRYEFRPPDGGLEVLGPDQIIHVSRLRRPGQLRGLSPIDEAAMSLGKMRSADNFGSRVFNNGMLLVGAVNVPGTMNADQLKELRENIEAQYTGAINQGKFGIFASGAKFEYPQLDIEKLQLLAVLGWGRAEIGAIYHIPGHLMGDLTAGSVSYGSVEQQYIEFTDLGVRPYSQRIEAGYRRLLDPGQFLRFNLNAKVRADIKSRFEAYHMALTDKWMVVDEVRELEERAPYGKDAGGGFLETPNNNAPAPGRVQA